MHASKSADCLFEVEELFRPSIDNLDHLTQQLMGGVVVPFVGAGLSHDYKYPLWSQFLAETAKDYRVEADIQSLLDAEDFEKAAELLHTTMGDGNFTKLVVRKFGKTPSTPLPTGTAASILPRLTRGAIITTNYDTVLERVFQQADASFDKVVPGASVDKAIRALHGHSLIKLHGDATDPEDRVLTQEDYEKFYGKLRTRSQKPLPRVLERVFLYPILFLGCSLNIDRSLKVLKLTSDHNPDIPHFAIAEAPKDRSELIERHRTLGNHGISVVWYPKGAHFLVTQLLEHLASRVENHSGVDESAAREKVILMSTEVQLNDPLNWHYPVQDLYVNQDQAIHYSRQGKKEILGQIALMGIEKRLTEAEIRVSREPVKFTAVNIVEQGYLFHEYARVKQGKHLHDGENARLVSWDAVNQTLIFQKCSYFDYLKTNLALDFPDDLGRTLRAVASDDGRVEPLESSKLTNTTGINGLVFSDDGFMIIQKRTNNVIIRPRELCSGFSGTVDDIDIVHVTRSGNTLADFDAPREMVEELGIKYEDIVEPRCFLGITRELVRGGTPEMFYAVDVRMSKDQIMSCLPRDREGIIRAVDFRDFDMVECARSILTSIHAQSLEAGFDKLLDHLEQMGPISIPLMTNLLLWLRQASPDRVTLGKLVP